MKVPLKTHKVAIQNKVVKGQPAQYVQGDNRLRRVRIKHNETKKALRTLERLRICWDIESTHVEINDLLMSVICFCVFC